MQLLHAFRIVARDDAGPVAPFIYRIIAGWRIFISAPCSSSEIQVSRVNVALHTCRARQISTRSRSYSPLPCDRDTRLLFDAMSEERGTLTRGEISISGVTFAIRYQSVTTGCCREERTADRHRVSRNRSGEGVKKIYTYIYARVSPSRSLLLCLPLSHLGRKMFKALYYGYPLSESERVCVTLLADALAAVLSEKRTHKYA